MIFYSNPEKEDKKDKYSVIIYHYHGKILVFQSLWGVL